MKMTLNQSIIINKLSIDVKPGLDKAGKAVYLPNPERKPYLNTDSHRDSSVGFGAKNKGCPWPGRALSLYVNIMLQFIEAT
jgi:hypothetical protein